MLHQFIPHLVKDLELGDTTLGSGVPGTYALPLDEGLAVNMTDTQNGFLLKANIAPYPKAQGELFATQTMLGNLFGQGTRGAVLGLSLDGNTLTLSQAIEYSVDYKEFKEILEDFINTVDFWREEAASIH